MSMRMDQVPDLELTPEQKVAFVFAEFTQPEGIVPRLALAVFGDGNGDEGMRAEIRAITKALASRRHSFWQRLGYDVLKNVASVAVLAVGGYLVATFLVGLRLTLVTAGGQ